MNRDRDLKCGDCGKPRDVLDPFVAGEAAVIAHLYDSVEFHPGYDVPDAGARR
jgi:hypothetical protein